MLIDELLIGHWAAKGITTSVSDQSICCCDVKGKEETLAARASKQIDYDWSCYIFTFNTTGNCCHNYLMEKWFNICRLGMLVNSAPGKPGTW